MNELLNRTSLLIKGFGLDRLNDSGQNFLVDEDIIKKEVKVADLNKNDIVLEVGAGFGYELAEIIKTCSAIGIEKDVKIFSYLINKYELNPSVKLVNGDVLKLVLPNFTKLISNPPYNIVDNILSKLMRYDFLSGVMILPNTLSQELLADASSNKFSIIQKIFFNFSEIMEVPKDAFYPIPRVTSRMLILKKRPKDFLQSVMLKDEMTVKNAILRAHQDLDNKTKRESRDTFSSLDVNAITFKDKEIKKLGLEELKTLVNFLRENYVK